MREKAVKKALEEERGTVGEGITIRPRAVWFSTLPSPRTPG